MSQVMDHVRELSDIIGPRPAATDAEARAADYIEDVFRNRGLEVERQEFSTPRTYSWAYVICNLLTLGAAALSLVLPVPALVIAVLAAALLWLELSGRFSLSRLLGTGPSQNVIARHVPRQRRGERLKRVVVVAHYDTAKSSLVFSPGMVKNLALFVRLTFWTSVATPIVIAFGLLPFAKEWRPWTGYAACLAAVYLLFPLLVNVQREVLGHATDGANDNASGVAAMLAVMEATVPEPDEAQMLADRPRRRSVEIAYEAGVAPEDALLEYRPVTESTASAAGTRSAASGEFDALGDVDWETGAFAPVKAEAPTPPAPAPTPAPAPAAAPATSGDWSEEAGIGSLWEDEPAIAPQAAPAEEPRRAAPPRPAPAPVPARWDSKPPRADLDEEEISSGQTALPLGSEEAGGDEPEDEHGQHGHGISAWLGIGKGFDVRKAGKRIGNWDNIDHDDDEFGFKAGTAGEERDEMADAAARIRRRVTEQIDRALVEKEIWFVATGADEAGGWGVRALLDAYEDDLRDALIINLEAVGSGSVFYLTEEGLLRARHGDRRLIGQAKRTARENDLAVKGRSFRGLATSLTPALARRFKGMTVKAFDINGRVPNWHWPTDTIENVVERTVVQAADFVTAVLRDL